MEDRGRSLRRAATLTAAVGALHAILFLVAYFLLAGAPGPQATDEEIYAGFVVGAFMLPSVSLTPLLLLVFPAWLIALSTILLIKARSIPREVRLPSGTGAMFGRFSPHREDDDPTEVPDP